MHDLSVTAEHALRLRSQSHQTPPHQDVPWGDRHVGNGGAVTSCPRVDKQRNGEDSAGGREPRETWGRAGPALRAQVLCFLVLGVRGSLRALWGPPVFWNYLQCTSVTVTPGHSAALKRVQLGQRLSASLTLWPCNTAPHAVGPP